MNSYQVEKDDFCSRLSSLSNAELFDNALLVAMKRTVQIVLENGKSSDIAHVKDKKNDSVEVQKRFVSKVCR